MVKKKNNDQLILSKQKEIQISLDKIAKAKKGFNPNTNLVLHWNNTAYNLNVLNKEQILLLIHQLHSFSQFLKSRNESVKVSNYNIEDWIEDLENQYNKINLRNEENRLKTLEENLKNYLSNEMKTTIAIETLLKQ